MKTLTESVKTDIRHLLDIIEVQTPQDLNGELCDICKSGDTCQWICTAMQLTVATNDQGDAWNYQTGDNSYTGGAYSLPHWSVVYLDHEMDKDQIMTEIVDQLEELINQ